MLEQRENEQKRKQTKEENEMKKFLDGYYAKYFSLVGRSSKLNNNFNFILILL